MRLTLPLTLITSVVLLSACSDSEQASTTATSETQAANAATVVKQWESDRPAFYGVWQVAGDHSELKTLDGSEPPLLPEAKASYDKNRELIAQGDRSWDPVYQCDIHGVPRILFETMPFEILQTPKQVLFMYQWNREFRMVDMNTEHSELPINDYLGQSVGHWEGDTLVIATTQLNAATFLDDSGMPHSESLHVIERYTVLDDGTMEVHLWIEDPETFSESWETVARFERLPGVKIKEDTCVERLDLPQYR